MPYNGAGTFTLYSPGNPVVTGTTISSTWANNTLTDLATGLSTALTKDGQTTPTANIPMGGYKLTGLAAGSASGDSVRYGQLGALALLNTVATAQIDDDAVTVAKLNDAAASGVKNYILNGGCQIAQTGSVTVTPADNVFIVGGTDMAASACTNRTSMAVNNAANTGMVTGYAHQITLTSSAAGVVNGAFRIEAKDAVALNGKTVTFACKGYQNSGGSLQARLRIRKPSASDDFTTLTTISTGSDFAVADSTVVPASLTVTLGASDATNGLQVEIEYTTAAAVTGKVFQIGDVRLVQGSVAPAMAADTFANTLAQCKRYLRMTYSYGTAPGTATTAGGLYYYGANTNDAGQKSVRWSWETDMRVAGTVTYYAPSTGAAGYFDADGVQAVGVYVAYQGLSGVTLINASGPSCTYAAYHVLVDARLK